MLACPFRVLAILAALPAFAEERPVAGPSTFYDGITRTLLALGYTEPELSDPELHEMIARDPDGREVILTIRARDGTVERQVFHDRRVIQTGRRGRAPSELAGAR